MTGARQLSLWGGKRQRGRRAPAPLEFAVHCTIADALRASPLAPGWSWFHPPNGGERPARIVRGKRVSFEGSRLARMGLRPGVADFLLFGPPHATLHAFELKRRGEKPTEVQLAWGAEVIAAGGKWAWGDTLEAAIAQFSEWGAVRSTLRVQ